MWRKHYREVPLKPVLQNVGAGAHRVVWIRTDVAFLARAMIVSSRQPTVRTCENDIRVFWRRRDPARLAAADVEPVARADAVSSRATRDAHRGIVLLRAVDVVWKIVVNRDAIKLRRGLVLIGPASAAVERNVCAAVVALNHPVWIVRSDPEIVVVAVWNGDGAVSAAAVV